jgi:hypothetical protein
MPAWQAGGPLHGDAAGDEPRGPAMGMGLVVFWELHYFVRIRITEDG